MKSPTNTIRNTVRVAIVFTIVWTMGCGQPATEMTGVVSLDGQPVPNAAIVFSRSQARAA